MRRIRIYEAHSFGDGTIGTLIFCAPTYVFHAPGQLKTLLDHFGYRWLIHRPDLSFMEKQAVIINTAGGGGRKTTVQDIRDSMNYWGLRERMSFRRACGIMIGQICRIGSGKRLIPRLIELR